MIPDQPIQYEYKCPFCKEYFTVTERESFKEYPCPHCRATVVPEPPGLSKGPIVKVKLNVHQRRVLAGVLGLLLGAFGAHKFALNYNVTGTIMLVASLFLAAFDCRFWLFFCLIGVAEGLIYLLTPDARFEKRYLQKKHYWF